MELRYHFAITTEEFKRLLSEAGKTIGIGPSGLCRFAVSAPEGP